LRRSRIFASSLRPNKRSRRRYRGEDKIEKEVVRIGSGEHKTHDKKREMTVVTFLASLFIRYKNLLLVFNLILCFSPSV
jgi:hypothetical protein